MSPDRLADVRQYAFSLLGANFFTAIGAMWLFEDRSYVSTLMIFAGGVWFANALIIHDRMTPPPRLRELL